MKSTLKKIFSLKEPRNGLLFIFILSLILAASVFFISKNNTNANYDYICTQTIQTGGACVIPADGWSQWRISRPATADRSGETQRVGTGSREALVKTYVASTRNACGAGTVQTVRGTAVNSSTYWGGETHIGSAVCQIIEHGVIPPIEVVCIPPQIILPNGTCGMRGDCPPGGCPCVAPQVMLSNGSCGDAEIVDRCSNIDGVQETLGDLSIDTYTGECGHEGGDRDMCLNVPGFQAGIPITMTSSSTMGVRQCTNIDIDATKVTTFLTINSTCTAKQGTSSVIYLNKDMEWTVNIPANIASGLTINDTTWTGTDILPTTGKITSGTNILNKIYTTVGLKTITGSVSARNADASIIYTIKCENNGEGKSPLSVTFGGGSTVEQ